MKERESNFEGLRVVAMCMVVVLHLDGASVGLPQAVGPWAATGRDWWRLAVEAAAIVGVNCFTMISGYFGIRLTWRSVGRFLGVCAFYSVGITTVMMLHKALAGGEPWAWARWGEAWMVLSHTDLWYVPAYFGLCLLAPLLNAGLDALSRRQMTWTLVAFVAFNCYCGWWHGGRFNPTGYTVVQLVMMYLIGGYMHRYVDFRRDAARLRLWAAAVYVWMVMAVTFMGLFCRSTFTFAYNSPLVVAESVALFIVFGTWRFHSPMVNRLAAGAFAVYLIHKHPIIWIEYLRPLMNRLWHTTTLAEYAALCVLITAAIYLLCTAIDYVRRAVVAWCQRCFERRRNV